MVKMSSEALAQDLEKMRRLTIQTLAKYGEPTISREELRRRLAAELPADFSLSEFLIKERESGW